MLSEGAYVLSTKVGPTDDYLQKFLLDHQISGKEGNAKKYEMSTNPVLADF